MSLTRQSFKFQLTIFKEDYDYESIWNQILMEYCIVGREKCPTTGRMHYHVFIIYKRNRRLSAVLKDFSPHHVEICKGSIDENINYVRKDGDVVLEKGQLPEERKRDKEAVFKRYCQEAKEGTIDKESILYARYRSFFNQLEIAHMQRFSLSGDLDKKNLWIYGPPGTGKSRMIQEYIVNCHKTCYLKLLNKWWDGFFKQDVVIIEDADPQHCEKLAHHFKIWCDRYSFTAEVKNGVIIIFPQYEMIVTSNYTIEACFPEGDVEAIRRRFDILYLP